MRIDEALAWANTVLKDGESPVVDSKVLLADVLKQSQTYLFTWPDKVISDAEEQQFKQVVTRRHKGEPVAHILGYRDFWSLRLAVTPDTLIPRPETELLVEAVLERAEPHHKRVCDLGTGTGAIALALAVEHPEWYVLGVDRIDAAIALAQQNAENNQVFNADWLASHWFDAIPNQAFDFIVTNPPYVESNSEYLQQGDVRFEPDSALTSGDDGLDDIRHITKTALEYLAPNGYLVIEHGHNQQPEIIKMMQAHGYVHCQGLLDLNGLPRVTLGQKG